MTQSRLRIIYKYYVFKIAYFYQYYNRPSSSNFYLLIIIILRGGGGNFLTLLYIISRILYIYYLKKKTNSVYLNYLLAVISTSLSLCISALFCKGLCFFD